MTYYQLLSFLKDHQINIIKAFIANEVNFFFENTFKILFNNEEKYKQFFETLCNLIYQTYLKTDGFSIEEITQKSFEIITKNNLNIGTFSIKDLILQLNNKSNE